MMITIKYLVDDSDFNSEILSLALKTGVHPVTAKKKESKAR